MWVRILRIFRIWPSISPKDTEFRTLSKKLWKSIGIWVASVRAAVSPKHINVSQNFANISNLNSIIPRGTEFRTLSKKLRKSMDMNFEVWRASVRAATVHTKCSNHSLPHFLHIFAALVLRYCYILHTNPSTSTMSSHSQHSTRFRFGSLLRSLFFYDWLSVYGQRAHATILITFRFMMVPEPLNSLKICRYVESRSRLAKRWNAFLVLSEASFRTIVQWN